MSNAVFPSLIGLGWNVVREVQWGGKATGGGTIVQENVSGKEVRVARRIIPRRQYTLSYDILRSDNVNLELQQLEQFFNNRSGMFDSFLFSDPDDSSVTGQSIGTGDGTTTTFQLVRNFDGFVEPVYAPNIVTNVYLNGVAQSGGSYSVSTWTAPSTAANGGYGGLVTFTAAPPNGNAITADFTYYWPVRFMDDSVTFNKFMQTFWDNKKVSFITLI